jgi:hypothetical protein
MVNKVGNNEKCPCGSGLKYKKCCKIKSTTKTESVPKWTQSERDEWFRNISNAPFYSRIYSENGESSSITVSSASVTRNGITTELFNDEITLSTNQVEGEKTDKSYAIMSVPQTNETKPEFSIGGNANIKNNNDPYLITIKDNPKQIKLKSAKGLFAIIKIVDRRDCGYKCFDLIFGEKGRDEIQNSEGIKTRPHLTIFPDGNNKYLRFSGYRCKMECKLEYDSIEKTIIPITSTIFLEDYSEQLILDFFYQKESNTVELVDARFI